MKHLSRPQVSRIERALAERAGALRQEIRSELLQSDEQHHRDIAGAAGDAGDEAFANLLADLDAAFLDRHVRELRAVDAARERLAAGAFGSCVDCGEGIAYERLLAYPTALRCAGCQTQHERTHAHERTPTL